MNDHLLAMTDSAKRAKELTLQAYTYSFSTGRITMEEFEKACEEIESTNSEAAIMAIQERLPIEVISNIQSLSPNHASQIVRGGFSKVKKRGDWLRSRRLFVFWSFGRIHLDLRSSALSSLHNQNQIDINFLLQYAKCRIIIPQRTVIIDSAEFFQNAKLRCPKYLLNCHDQSSLKLILHGRIINSRINICVRKFL